jgi:L-ascorbate metabolism protein UlaG (beta-lactamase superfamily)
MKITKLGHCCLLIEENGTVIMTDPGAWTTAQNEVKGVDIVLITHEHVDHFHIDSLKTVLANNPQAIVITNNRVRDLAGEQGIAATVLENGQRTSVPELEIAAFGTEHAIIYPTIPPVMNTGYLIQNRFFYPGDAFTNPGVPVEILAVPMIGPWMKMSEALDWAKALKPQICIPVHDGMLQPREWIYGTPTKVLSEAGIRFDALEPGTTGDYMLSNT